MAMLICILTYILLVVLAGRFLQIEPRQPAATSRLIPGDYKTRVISMSRRTAAMIKILLRIFLPRLVSLVEPHSLHCLRVSESRCPQHPHRL